MKKKNRRQKRGRPLSMKALEKLTSLVSDLPQQPDYLIEYLHRIQDHLHCLPVKYLHATAKLLGLSQVEVYEVASFYHHFDIIKEGESQPKKLTVRVCESISCQMHGSEGLTQALQNKHFADVTIQRVPCVGRCGKAPVVVVGDNPVENATVNKVSKAIDNNDIAATQQNLISYQAYRQAGGYSSYIKIKRDFNEETKEQILTSLDESGLRGLGGAGFPVGRKWRIVGSQPSPRLMAVNIDEGEPGTFKDRYYLEKDPRRFIEGMLIAALIADVSQITVYIRDEYTACRLMLENEFKEMRADPRLDFPDIQLRRGAGAYICGEESAMLQSIEGKRGMPQLRPPFVAEKGLFGRPTLVQNLESLYWARDIVVNGSDWFTSQGRHGRKGLRSFSVSGRINKPGVYHAPAGITLQELIDEYCGGMQQGHELYGYLPGGASGGILPASLANTPLDFDTLQEHGCFIGSAAVIVFSDKDSARDIALNAMRFFEHESCGQCTPCRVGTNKAVKLMETPEWDINLMQELSTVMQDASICGLGQAAPNPMNCVIRYFPDELCKTKEITKHD